MFATRQQKSQTRLNMFDLFYHHIGVDHGVETPKDAPLHDLPRLMPRFFVPLLENKPQNPIMDSLKLEEANTNLPTRIQLQRLPDELLTLSLANFEARGTRASPTSLQELWDSAAQRKLGVRVSLKAFYIRFSDIANIRMGYSHGTGYVLRIGARLLQLHIFPSRASLCTHLPDTSMCFTFFHCDPGTYEAKCSTSPLQLPGRGDIYKPEGTTGLPKVHSARHLISTTHMESHHREICAGGNGKRWKERDSAS